MTVADSFFDDLRATISRLLAADRRQRGRDQQRRDGTLSHAQLRSLFVLVRQDEVTVGTLAKAADLNPASITAMIDQLEEAGLVSRRRDIQDRRQSWVALTEAGRQQVAEKERYWRAQMDEAFRDIAPEEIAAAIKVMERIATTMEQHNDQIDADDAPGQHLATSGEADGEAWKR
jgi:MarR family transcriptional regulator, organic hydroperoxide resistance regulator